MLEIPIQSLAHGGDAVGRLADGRTAFVSGGCPGDVAAIEITEDHGRFVRARLTEIVEASPDRRQAPLPLFRAVRRLLLATRLIRAAAHIETAERHRRARADRPHHRPPRR